MGLLARELGCDIHWDESACVVQHPGGGGLCVVVNRNCPEIEASMCLELIAEVEQGRAASMMRSIQPGEKPKIGSRAWDQMSNKELMSALKGWVKQEFEQAPACVQERVVPHECHDAAASGLNRHTCRKLERGSAFVHLFSGAQRWDHPSGTPSVSLDLQPGFDIHSDPLFWSLLQLARHETYPTCWVSDLHPSAHEGRRF